MNADTRSRIATRTFRFLPFLALSPFLIGSPPARADCLVDYADCVEAAAELNTFPKRSLAGLGCYVDLLSCLQRRLA